MDNHTKPRLEGYLSSHLNRPLSQEAAERTQKTSAKSKADKKHGRKMKKRIKKVGKRLKVSENDIRNLEGRVRKLENREAGISEKYRLEIVRNSIERKLNVLAKHRGEEKTR